MNRGQLVETVVKTTKLSKRQADGAITAVLDGIKSGVKKDGEVLLVGFGTFKKVTRKARNGRNPQTGAALKIAKKTVTKFRPSKVWEGGKVAAKKSK